MKILALELSTTRRSAAVYDPPAGRLGVAHEVGGRHSRPIALIEAALQDAQTEREEIGVLALGMGPGSYTGIRVGISLAQGWHAATGTKLLGLSTVDCLAEIARLEGRRGETDFCIDAQRNEFYLATYALEEDGFRIVTPLRLVAQQAVNERVQQGVAVLGPDLGKALPTTQELYPDARVLAKLAAARNDFIPGEALEPIYLRPISFVKAPTPRLIV